MLGLAALGDVEDGQVVGVGVGHEQHLPVGREGEAGRCVARRGGGVEGTVDCLDRLAGALGDEVAHQLAHGRRAPRLHHAHALDHVMWLVFALASRLREPTLACTLVTQHQQNTLLTGYFAHAPANS